MFLLLVNMYSKELQFWWFFGFTGLVAEKNIRITLLLKLILKNSAPQDCS